MWHGERASRGAGAREVRVPVHRDLAGAVPATRRARAEAGGAVDIFMCVWMDQFPGLYMTEDAIIAYLLSDVVAI